MLDALDALGMRGDGRLLALNSYENRVYQVWLEDGTAGRRQVLPARALERRADRRGARVRAELAEREIPVVAPLASRRTLHRSAAFASRSIRAAAGARPSSTIRNAGVDRPLHRPHPRRRRARAIRSIGRRSTSRRFGDDAARLPARPRLHAGRPAGSVESGDAAGAAARATRASSARARCKALRLHGDCHAGNMLWTDARPAFRRLRRRAHGTGDAGPVDAALRRPRGDGAAAARRARRLRAIPCSSTGASCISSRRCAHCA